MASPSGCHRGDARDSEKGSCSILILIPGKPGPGRHCFLGVWGMPFRKC